MTTTRFFFVRLFSLLLVALTFFQCQKEDINPSNPNNPDPSAKTGTANIQMTDAPIDNANIESVFITVAEVKVDGEAYDGFSGKQTIDIMAYQNGDVKALGIGELETGTYSNLTLVLDYEADASGTAPGCYVLTKDGAKESLNVDGTSKEEITLFHNFEIEENTQTDLVMDFDLRKTITAEADNNNEWDFSFVTDAELQKGVRVVNESESGSVEGTCQESISLYSGDKIVVYAYAKGDYDASIEMETQGSSNIEFANAVSSAAIQADGSYHLAFLQEGDYELVFISYEENADGNLEVKGQLELITNLGIDLQNVSVNAESSVTLNVNVTGIIP